MPPEQGVLQQELGGKATKSWGSESSSDDDKMDNVQHERNASASCHDEPREGGRTAKEKPSKRAQKQKRRRSNTRSTSAKKLSKKT
jgi:hypothetical protein